MQNWKPMQIDRQIFKRKSNKLTVNLFRDVLSRYAKIIFHLKMSNFNHNFNEMVILTDIITVAFM